MAHFQAVCKAISINKLKKQLAQEKLNAIQIQEGEDPNLTLGQKYRHFFIDLRLKTQKCFSLSETSALYRFYFSCKHEGSFQNFVLKSILGFLGGFLLTYIVFMFFVVQLNFKLSTATLMCSILGTILIIGLAFSSFVRCIVFLTLPQFFSKRGRQALLAYAFILAITGPAKNTLNNMGILSESLACGQEQLKAAVRQIIDVIKKPFYAIKDAIKTVVKTVKMIVKKIKEILLKIKRIIMAILRVIKSAFQFLGKILNVCNKELGTPFERCGRVFENAILDCNAKLGPLFNWLCSITYLVKSVCYIVKWFDFVCMLVDFIKDSVIGVVVKKVKNFVRHIRTMFYVRIKFSHSFHFQTNASKTYSEVASGIVTEIKQRAQGFMVIFDFISLATSFFFVFLIIKVMHYRYKFLTSERFDNHYITHDFRIIDLQRAKFGKETVLPLNHREQTMYVNMSSMRLVKNERRKLAKSAVVLLVASIKLGSHMVTDYSLYWVLNMINYHGRFQSKVKAPNIPTLQIKGEGLLADLLKAVVNAFQPLGIQIEIDTVPCLPNPLPPDYDRYIQIASLLVLCWILTLLEPYGLRFRHWIMCYYHPIRARERAVWLYNHIMRSRLSFLKLARRMLRRKVLGHKNLTKVTCKEFIRSKLKCGFCTICFGEDKQEACLLCGEVFRESDSKKPIRCSTPGCPGIYCEQCYSDLQNLCTVCLSPIDYGDLSDFSEEKGSTDSDEEDYKKARKSMDRSIEKLGSKDEAPFPSSSVDGKGGMSSTIAEATQSGDRVGTGEAAATASQGFARTSQPTFKADQTTYSETAQPSDSADKATSTGSGFARTSDSTFKADRTSYPGIVQPSGSAIKATSTGFGFARTSDSTFKADRTSYSGTGQPSDSAIKPTSIGSRFVRTSDSTFTADRTSYSGTGQPSDSAIKATSTGSRFARTSDSTFTADRISYSGTAQPSGSAIKATSTGSGFARASDSTFKADRTSYSETTPTLDPAIETDSRTSRLFAPASQPSAEFDQPNQDRTTDEDEDKQIILLHKSPAVTDDESSDSSGYSYTYQYDKPSELPAIERNNTRSFRDVESQRIPDYASMSSFREAEEIEERPSVFSNILTRSRDRRSGGFEESIPLLAATKVDRATMTGSKHDAETSMSDFPYKD